MSAADWSDWQLRRLVEGRGRGESFADIAHNIGKTKNACIGMLRRCCEESDKLEVQK